jgi:hypothetical protein
VLALSASLSQERVLAFNATNFTTADDGANGDFHVNTIQGIATTSTPQFLRGGFGAASSTDRQVSIAGAFTLADSGLSALKISSVITTDVGRSAYGLSCYPEFVTAASGTTASYASAVIGAPTITINGTAVVTDAAALYVADVTGTGATNEYSILSLGLIGVRTNTATSAPFFWANQTSTGDAAMRWSLATTISYALGIDNSVAGDPFVLSTAASGTAVLGTGNLLSITSAGNATLTGTLQATRAGLGAAVAATERLRLLSDYVPGGTENEIITFQLSASNPANFHVAIGEFPNVGGGQPDSTMFIGYNVSGDAFTKVINEPSNFIGFESHYTPNGTTVQMEQYLQYFQPNGTDYYRPIASYYNYYTTPPVLQTELQGSFIIFNDMTSLVSTPNEIARFVSSTRNMGIGTTSIDARLHVSAATAQTRLLQVGPGLVSGNHAAYINAVCDAAQTTRYACLQLAPTTAAAAFTCADVMGFYIPSWTVGAGSAITRATGAAVYLGIESASVNSAGFYYGDVPPAYTGHWSFYAGSGAAYFASTVQATRAGFGVAPDANRSLSLAESMTLVATTSSTTGVIYKGADRFIHNFALAGTDGYNTFVGLHAGNFTMTGSTGVQGSYNSAMGYYVLFSNTTGSSNSAMGYYALFSNTTGSNNSAMGHGALFSNTGSSNSAMGYCALFSNTTGSSNSALGMYAGYNAGVTLDALSYCTFVGYSANASANSLTNSTAIGNGAQITASNQIILGNASVTTCGIGTFVPGAMLEILKTTEQLRLSYDSTHLASFVVEANGILQISDTYDVVYLKKTSDGALKILLDMSTNPSIKVGRWGTALVAITENEISSWSTYGVTQALLYIQYYGGGVSVNAGGYDADYTIASDTNAYCFRLDGGYSNVTINAVAVSDDYDLGLCGNGALLLKETTTPTANADYGKVYCKSDNKLYFQDGAGSEHEVALAT